MVFRIMLLGNSSRECVIASSLLRSSEVEIYCVLEKPNQYLITEAKSSLICSYDDHRRILDFAKENKVDLIFLTNNKHMFGDIATYARQEGFKTFGPGSDFFVIERDKFFFYQMISSILAASSDMKIHVPETVAFSDPDKAFEFLQKNPSFSVIKPRLVETGNSLDIEIVGRGFLKTSKSVRKHLHKIHQRLRDKTDQTIVLQEKIDSGTEFLEIGVQILRRNRKQFVFPVTRDYKRVKEENRGLNSSGVMSVSVYDSSLSKNDSPDSFQRPEEHFTVPGIRNIEVLRTVQKFARVFGQEIENFFGKNYEGVLYPQFIVEKQTEKIYILECNCRFGDPESTVSVSLLKISLFSIIRHLYDDRSLFDIETTEPFEKCSALSVYLNPKNYPLSISNRKSKIRFPVDLPSDLRCYLTGAYADFHRTERYFFNFVLTGDRGIVLVLLCDTIKTARKRIEGFIENEMKLENVDYRTDF